MDSTTGHGHDPDPTIGAAHLQEVIDGIFAWIQPDGSWWINNAGAVSGPDGTIIIDTCATEQRTQRFLAAVRDATGNAPIRVAANTHEHGDHTYGNSVLPTETALVGHENMRSRLLIDPVIEGCPPVWDPLPDWGSVSRRVPNVVIHSDLTVFTGQRRVELIHPGYPAHTTGDLVAWLPAERVLYSGDLIFHGLTPLVIAGSVEGALRSLDWLADFQPDHLIPGHGPIVTAADFGEVLAQHERYYRFVSDAAAQGRRDGIGPLDAARRADLGSFGQWPDAERLVLNLHRAYAVAAGTDVDLAQAFLDAVIWNGGALTTHVCCNR